MLFSTHIKMGKIHCLLWLSLGANNNSTGAHATQATQNSESTCDEADVSGDSGVIERVVWSLLSLCVATKH